MRYTENFTRAELIATTTGLANEPGPRRCLTADGHVRWAAGTTRFNGFDSLGAIYGGALVSSIAITEIQV